MEVETFRCTNCGAPLEVGEAGKTVRCLYCGTDHEVVDRAADEKRHLEANRRVGAVVGPYLFMPGIGFLAVLCAHDLWRSTYQGYPAVGLEVIGLVAVFSGFRVPGALILGLTGLATVLKPWLWPIRGYSQWTLSPTSETGLYYVIPALVCLAVAVIVVARLRVRELRPALRALRPRLTVGLVLIAGAVGAWFVIHPTGADLLAPSRATAEHLRAVARQACAADMPVDSSPLTPRPVFHRDYHLGNTVIVSCSQLEDPKRGVDPLTIGGKASYLFATLDGWNDRWLYRSADIQARRLVRELEMLRYLVVYRTDKTGATATVVDMKTGDVVGSATAATAKPIDMRLALLADLGTQTGGSFN